jgi:sucrose phosphorylase
MKNQVQLITYVDRLSGGGLRELRQLLNGPLAGVFGGAHLLPFFLPIDGADAGFDPTDHAAVDPQLGNWEDVRALGRDVELMADLIVNHVSVKSPQFEDYLQHGDHSRYAGMFLTYSRVFPEGAYESALLPIYRPRPGLPFTHVRFADGSQRLLWTTFTPQQTDIDVTSTAGRAYLTRILEEFHRAGIRAIRLDAAGYAVKKAGTSCFMIPETFAFLSEFTEQAHALGMEVLVEIHSYYREQIEVARRVDLVYDFALPPLVLHSLYNGNGSCLKEWLAISPRNAVTVLDTHDGIGVIDVGADAKDPLGRPGLLTPAEIDALVETIHERSQGESRQATGAAASNLDLYQVNCTFYDALGRDDAAFWIARALQFFAPGIPQVYYVGLLAGLNDMQLLSRSRIGRDINRHYYSREEVQEALARPIVQRLLELIRLRNTHPAFQGEFHLESTPPEVVEIVWRAGSDWARLEVNLAAPSALVTYTTRGGTSAMQAGNPGRTGAHS